MAATTTASPHLVDLPSFAFTVATFLEGEDILTLRLVSRGVKTLLIDSDDDSDAIWTLFLRREFNGYEGRLVLRVRESLRGPSVFGTTGSDAVAQAECAFDTWKQWKKASWRYFGGRQQLLKPTYYLRAANLWERIEQWLLLQDLTHIQSTFQQGISYEELPWPEHLLSLSTLTATQALLAFYGGQRHQTVPWLGLLGGFSVYNFVTCTRFVGGQFVDNAVTIGVCPLGRQFHSHKFFAVDTTTGQVKCQGTPTPALACRSTQPDAVLSWLEEYARRLESGFYQMGALFEQTLTHGPADAILHYPRQETLARTVTRGVEVVASAIFSPWTANHGFAFVYSIRIRLLTPEEPDYDPNRGFETCQLKSRHWQLVDEATGRIDYVDGDGVIGMYPLLREGSYRDDSGRSSASVSPGEEQPETFVYQSCTNDASATSFGGHMLFVPGSLVDPAGPDFRVYIGPFALDANPEYIY